jgi:hypothetical protein
MPRYRTKTASQLLRALRGHYKAANEAEERSFLGNVAYRAGQGAGIGGGLGLLGGAAVRVPEKGIRAVKQIGPPMSRAQIRNHEQLRQMIAATALGVPVGLVGGAVTGAGEHLLHKLRARSDQKT